MAKLKRGHNRPIKLSKYDNTLLYSQCKCDPLETVCLPDASGHYGDCPVRHAYMKALIQASSWMRLAQVIEQEGRLKQIERFASKSKRFVDHGAN